MSNTFLFVDGSNLYAAQYALFGPDHYLNFSLFVKKIETVLQINFHHIYFYASYSPQLSPSTSKKLHYLKNEALFYKSVKESKKITFFKGYRSPTSGKEKEVDVKLAADVVDLAHRDRFNTMYLLSGDADFLQALLLVKNIGKKITILCLENKIMYKGTFRFPAVVICFHKKKSIIHCGNNTKRITLYNESLIKAV